MPLAPRPPTPAAVPAPWHRIPTRSLVAWLASRGRDTRYPLSASSFIAGLTHRVPVSPRHFAAGLRRGTCFCGGVTHTARDDSEQDGEDKHHHGRHPPRQPCRCSIDARQLDELRPTARCWSALCLQGKATRSRRFAPHNSRYWATAAPQIRSSGRRSYLSVT
jgi:hypothetical protein